MQMMGQYQGFHEVARNENRSPLHGNHCGSQSVELTQVLEGKGKHISRMTSRQQRRAVLRKRKTSGLSWRV